MQTATVAINSFVRRQTTDSDFSHFEGNWEELPPIVSHYLQMNGAFVGYRQGVVLVRLANPFRFFTNVTKIQPGDKFVGSWKPRVPGETPRKTVRIKREGAKKQEAKSVFIVLYSHAVLEESQQAETSADYEIIAVNAFPADEKEPPPMDPDTLIHNHFGSDGGTDTKMKDREFVAELQRSFEYWKDKGLLEL